MPISIVVVVASLSSKQLSYWRKQTHGQFVLDLARLDFKYLIPGQEQHLHVDYAQPALHDAAPEYAGTSLSLDEYPVLGTPAYMAPEVLQAAQHQREGRAAGATGLGFYDAVKEDAWGIGAVFYYVATGSHLVADLGSNTCGESSSVLCADQSSQISTPVSVEGTSHASGGSSDTFATAAAWLQGLYAQLKVCMRQNKQPARRLEDLMFFPM